MIAVTRLLQLFPFTGVNDTLSNRFNALADQEIIRIRDFIILHYKATERTDSPYWDRCRTMEIPDYLAERIRFFQENAQVYQVPGELFQVDSWLQVMLGQRLVPTSHHLMGAQMPPEQLRAALDSLKGNIARAVARMPSHQAFLEQYAGIPAEAVPARAQAGGGAVERRTTHSDGGSRPCSASRSQSGETSPPISARAA